MARNVNPLYDELVTALLDVVEPNPPEPGELGFEEDGAYTIEVTGATGFVHVRLLNRGQSVIALNMGAPIAPDFPVKVYHTPQGVYAHVDENRVAAWIKQYGVANMVGPHSHEPGFGLFDYVSSIRLKPGLAFVTSGLTVQVLPMWYWDDDGALKLFPGGTFDLTSSVPGTAYMHRWAALAFNRATKALSVLTTTPKHILTALVPSEMEALDFTGLVPLMGFRLRNGQTGLQFSDFEDIRVWAGGGAGSSSVIETHYLMDLEGSFLKDLNGKQLVGVA